MKLINYGFVCMSMLAALTACNDENPWNIPDGQGLIAPSVTADSYVRDAIPTRAQAFAPDASQFGLRLTKTDGGFSQQWNSIAEFPQDKGFSSGVYTLEAFYGDIDEEGYNKPCYLGSSTINVRPGETTEASVTAQLANTMIDVKYTEAFQNYFADYSTTLHSEGHGYHELAKSIDDPVYLAPGKVTVTIAFTKPNGQSATIQPAEFTAEARHFYHITLDVNNGQVGDAQLVVKFDDSVQTEDVEIDLSDELLNLPAPEVSAKGFTDGETLNVLSGSTYDGEAAFSIFAAGGISSAVLTIQSQTYNPAFGKEIELVNADAALQQQLQDAGIRVLGLFRNPDQIAKVDLAGLLGNLPEGDHTFTLVVKDRLTRVNEPISFSTATSALILNIVRTSPVPFGASSADIVLAYNGDDLARNVTVKGMGDNGHMVDCPITAVSAATGKARRTRSDAFPAKNYNVSVSIPVTTRDMDLEVYYKGRKMDTGVITHGVPEYSLSSNDFARRSIIKVEGQTGSTLALITNNLRLFTAAGEIPSQNISRNPDTGELTVIGLNPSTTYHISSTTQPGTNYEISATHILTTEADAQPENGGMENWASITHPKKTILFVGDDYLEWFANDEASQSYWATRNPMTTYPESNRMSTLTYTVYCGTQQNADGASGKAADIFTVGWGAGNTHAGAGSIIKHKTAGMLFMGDYTYDGSEHFTYGRSFSSRPASLSFDYKYAPVNSESFKAYVVIEHREGDKVTELARGEFVSGTAISAFENKVITLKYSNTVLKATHAYIVFISSTSDNPATNATKYNGDSVHVGSILTVDNIKFNY